VPVLLFCFTYVNTHIHAYKKIPNLYTLDPDSVLLALLTRQHMNKACLDIYSTYMHVYIYVRMCVCIVYTYW